jgi:hypothetical protein
MSRDYIASDFLQRLIQIDGFKLERSGNDIFFSGKGFHLPWNHCVTVEENLIEAYIQLAAHTKFQATKTDSL